MKTLKHKMAAITFICLILSLTRISAQPGVDWELIGNVGAVGDIFGTTNATPINIVTGGIIPKEQFSVGASLVQNNPPFWPGDGLKIFDPTGIGRDLDLWTGLANTTHIQMGGSGNMDGQSNRFEIKGHFNGLWLDASRGLFNAALIPNMIFNTNGLERARLNGDLNPLTIGFMRVGDNPGMLDAGNRLEIDYTTATSPGSANGCGGTGFSGLRFSDLDASSTPCPLNPGLGVLALDTKGDVIYVPYGGSFGACPTPIVLSTDIGLNFSNKSVYFQDPASVTNQRIILE